MAKNINSNVTGTVLNLLVKVGDVISQDQDVLSVESMKMEMMVVSTESGTVAEIKVNVDDFIQEGQIILVLE